MTTAEQLTEYEATAGNLYFYQRLVVLARDIDEATDKFRDYLAEPENQKEEEEEFGRACEAYEDEVISGDYPRRENHSYTITDDAVTEFVYDPHWIGKAKDTVQVISSGGNG